MNIMKCNRCGKTFVENSFGCPFCGFGITYSISNYRIYICRNCETPYAVENAYGCWNAECPFCGSDRYDEYDGNCEFVQCNWHNHAYIAVGNMPRDCPFCMIEERNRGSRYDEDEYDNRGFSDQYDEENDDGYDDETDDDGYYDGGYRDDDYEETYDERYAGDYSSPVNHSPKYDDSIFEQKTSGNPISDKTTPVDNSNHKKFGKFFNLFKKKR